MRKLLKITLCAALALILTSSTPTVPDATCDASPRPTNEAVYRHNTDKKRVALTFDDGPHYKYTAEILDILDEYGAKATFFVVGELAERYPELILRELAEGHEIGNHTWSHPKMKKLTVDSLKQEILKTEELLNEIADYRPKLFRPPEGSFSDLAEKTVENCDHDFKSLISSKVLSLSISPSKKAKAFSASAFISCFSAIGFAICFSIALLSLCKNALYTSLQYSSAALSYSCLYLK